MCGIVFGTPKSSSGRINDESAPVKVLHQPRPYRHTPSHARVDSIMGVRSRYSAQDCAAASKEEDEREASLKNLDHYGSTPSINASSRSSSYNSLDQIPMGKVLMARRPSNSRRNARPRLHERRRPRSSPLVDFGMFTELVNVESILTQMELFWKKSNKTKRENRTMSLRKVSYDFLAFAGEVCTSELTPSLDFHSEKWDRRETNDTSKNSPKPRTETIKVHDFAPTFPSISAPTQSSKPPVESTSDG